MYYCTVNSSGLVPTVLGLKGTLPSIHVQFPLGRVYQYASTAVPVMVPVPAVHS